MIGYLYLSPLMGNAFHIFVRPWKWR